MYLRCHSHYSFQYGTLSPGELAELAVRVAPHRLSLTDINTMAAHVEFAKNCRDRQIPYNLGVEFHWKGHLAYWLIARNAAGYRWMNAWLSEWLNLQSVPGQPLPNADFPDSVWVLFPPDRFPEGSPDHFRACVRPADWHRRFSWQSRVPAQKLTACPTLTFCTPEMYDHHLVLRAIGDNRLLTDVDQNTLASREDYFRMPDAVRRLYAGQEEWLLRADRISNDCEYQMDFDQNRTFQTLYGSYAEDAAALRSLAEAGKIHRYGSQPNPEASARIEKELEVISRLRFQGYYLVTHDIIRYAASRGFWHVGRGSGANSIVAYCLGITDVDPIALDLYFERFLNASRNSPPDFDIDFSWKERDEVIRYILDTYNKPDFRASMLAATVRYKSRAVIRELGKVFGIARTEIESLTSRLPIQYYSGSEPPVQDSALVQHRNPVYRRILDLSTWLHRIPSHLSIHAGGILIARTSLYDSTATFIPPKGFRVSQIDMFDADDIHLHKLDILSQRGLGHIRDCITLISRHHGETVGNQVQSVIRDTRHIIHHPPSRALLKTGQTTGCFYIESPAMRSLIQKLGCDDFLALTAASSVIRPGVGHSGMMRTFIARFRGDEPVAYLHPELERLLKETFGVMIYQEDVLKVAHHFGGLTLEEADVLRRGISGKLRSREALQQLRQTFADHCREKGISDDITEEVWRQIESFAGYTFPKAHSASYAIESFQDLYLKHHYPLEFITAVVNNFGGFYSTWYYLEEARRLGADIALPCLNRSEYLCSLQGKVIYLGFILIKGLDESLVQTILENRNRYGPFRSVWHFAERVGCSPEQIRHLIRIGCFDFTGVSRPKLLWEFRMARQVIQETGNALFAASEPDPVRFDLQDWSLQDKLQVETEYLGFPVSASLFHLFGAMPEDRITSLEWQHYSGKTIRMVGYVCARKPVVTRSGQLMQFLTLRDPEGVWDAVLFPDLNSRIQANRIGPWLVAGKVQLDFGVPVLEITEMQVMG